MKGLRLCCSQSLLKSTDGGVDMGLYYDKLEKKIVQNDKALDMVEPERYVRHEVISPCECPSCNRGV